MPTGRGIRVVLLVEDEALERFIRHALLIFGFCLIIPKWNIESWLVYLCGDDVDESRDDYKNHRRVKDVDYAQVAGQFVERYRNWKAGNNTETALSSMIAAFEEMRQFGL
jgi:hypothetical protein